MSKVTVYACPTTVVSVVLATPVLAVLLLLYIKLLLPAVAPMLLPRATLPVNVQPVVLVSNDSLLIMFDESITPVFVGDSLTFTTLIVVVKSRVLPTESVTRTVTVSRGVVSESNVAPDLTCSWVPEIWNLLVAPPMSVYVNVSPASASVVANVPTTVPAVAFSITLDATPAAARYAVPDHSTTE